jgi:hypothetical protein
VRLVKGARSVDSEWKSRSRSSIRKSRRNRRGLEKMRAALGGGGPLNWETRATVVQLQCRCRRGFASKASFELLLHSTALHRPR